MGQPGRGFPLHWKVSSQRQKTLTLLKIQDCGDLSAGQSYVRGCSIHNSFNRGIVCQVMREILFDIRVVLKYTIFEFCNQPKPFGGLIASEATSLKRAFKMQLSSSTGHSSQKLWPKIVFLEIAHCILHCKVGGVLLPLGAKFRQNSKIKVDSWAICPPKIVG